MAAETVPPIQNVPFRGPLSQCREFRDIRFPSLPGTTQEVDVIASIWNRSHGKWNRASNGALPLKGRAATEEALKRDAPGKRILHVATHGFFINGDCLPDISGDRGIAGMTPSAPQANSEQAPGAQPPAAVNPLTLSGLALAGANQRQAAGPDEEDGILTAEEIAALDLNGMEWAVLSACNTGVGQTGVGRMDAGEGVFGLRRALQIAGVRTVISSLWQIRDEVAREWMKTLYECRFLKGHDTAQAVHEANLQLLKKRRSAGESTHPFYWAGFVAAGDWR
jgi:CHAT domain-containing protein